MKTIVLTGLASTVTEEEIRALLEVHYGSVEKVEIVRDGNPDLPLALVHMPLSDEAAFTLVQRLTDLWHSGHRINARLMLHGEE